MEVVIAHSWGRVDLHALTCALAAWNSHRIGKTFETGGSNLSLSAAPGACSRTSGRDGQATRQLLRGIPRRGEAFHRVHDMAQPNIFYCYTLAEEQSLPK